MTETRLLEPWGSFPPDPLLSYLIDVARSERARPAPKFARRFARSIGYRMSTGAVDATAYGFRARFYPHDNLAEKRVLFSPQEWDVAERLALLSVMHRDFYFIDIGANAGFYSLFVAASGGETARVLAVEPQPEMRDRLAFNIAANDMQANITIIDDAISDQCGEAMLHISHSNRGTSGLAHAQDEAEALPVRTTTLPALIHKHGWERIDALKIDIEGGEDKALPPLFDLPSALWPRMILMETRSRDWSVDLVAMLEHKDYEQTGQTRGNGIWMRR